MLSTVDDQSCPPKFPTRMSCVSVLVFVMSFTILQMLFVSSLSSPNFFRIFIELVDEFMIKIDIQVMQKIEIFMFIVSLTSSQKYANLFYLNLACK